jgi:hypothetical protein
MWKKPNFNVGQFRGIKKKSYAKEFPCLKEA